MDTIAPAFRVNVIHSACISRQYPSAALVKQVAFEMRSAQTDASVAGTSAGAGVSESIHNVARNVTLNRQLDCSNIDLSEAELTALNSVDHL